MAAYAPLLVNTNSRGWPTNLIVFDNHRCGTACLTPASVSDKLFPLRCTELLCMTLANRLARSCLSASTM